MKMSFKNCPRCKAKLIRAKSYAGTDSEFWLECSECNTFVNTYVPQEHQRKLHQDDHRYMGNFGGYGTGKTTTSREELMKHLIITDNANTVVGANVASQYEQTIKRELENDIPAAFVKNYSAQKQYMDLLNNSRIMWRSLDDPGKLRSLNLSMFIIIEGSETSLEVLTQLKTRLRNLSATTVEVDEIGEIVYVDENKHVPKIKNDWRKGIVESNPDAGYIRTDILLASDKINQFGTINDEYLQDPARIDKNISSYVAGTDTNKYLPPNFKEELSKNKPEWWIRRFLEGSFQFSEGLVYPGFVHCIVPAFDIPQDWKRVVAFDYGLVDTAAYVFGAIDPKEGILYIYKNPTTNNKTVPQLARIYHENSRDIPDGGLAFSPLIDPKSGPKRDFNKKTLSDLFLDEGIYFQSGQVDVDSRVFRLNQYIESGKLKVMDNCSVLIEEMKEYKFQPKTLDSISDKKANKPIDKNNHSINPLEWITMELPANPLNLLTGIYNSLGHVYNDTSAEARDVKLVPWQLSEEQTFYDNSEDPFQTPSFDINKLY